MAVPRDAYSAALDVASSRARAWLASLGDRPVPPSRSIEEIRAWHDAPFSEESMPADQVVEELAALVEPGLMAFGSGRFYGWVIGGGLPAAIAADWLVTAWDQNAGLRYATPGVVAAEEIAAGWLLDVLGLPGGADVGFVTGGTMANFTCLIAARHQVFADAGWDVETFGVNGAPRVRVLVGEQRHDTIDLTLRYLGLGAPTPVAVDGEGRIVVAELERMLLEGEGPTIVCLQAGNLHSGAFDPFAEAIRVAHAAGAWVHIDGAFGLWAGASPALRHLVAGYEEADSWATDAHKTLNVPYDCGVAIVAHPAAMRGSLGAHASYLIVDTAGVGDPLERVPEFSRRARGVPVWAALRSLGRSGVAGLVDGLVRHAQAIAAGVREIEGAEVLNQVDYTQVCLAFGSDDMTRRVAAALIEDGAVWMSGSQWRGRAVLRVSVSNWSSDDEDVRVSVDAVRRAVAQARGRGALDPL